MSPSIPGAPRLLGISPGAVALAALLVATVGCSSSVELSRESRRRIRNVSVSGDVLAHASYEGRLAVLDNGTRGEVWYSSFITAPIGVAYDLIDWKENQRSRSASLSDKLLSMDIDVAAITREEFIKHVEGTDMFLSVRNPGGEATFELEVDYGLNDGMGIRGAWKTYLTVRAWLIDEDGEVVWHHTEEVLDSDGRLPEIEAPLVHPDRLARSYRIAAGIATERLARHLQRG